MREIKFRAWDNISRTWLTSNCGIFTIGLDGEFYFQDLFRGNRIMDKVSDQIDSVICQYTGLKDKNGVEIYEGDIVKHNDDYVVKWFDKYMRFGLSRVVEMNCLPMLITSMSKVEVIGNIYENPELLKKKESEDK